ncbi:hypothetical protein [Actinomadura xylanilytica]|nr:hypothetical protein [Actinomadura xylanilytica]MDL4770773.1 hypothetical protein [Actinomadura xylanilytica]
MDLRFSLREPRAYQSTPDEIIGLARAHGMTPRRRFGLGVWQWYSFGRD